MSFDLKETKPKEQKVDMTQQNIIGVNSQITDGSLAISEGAFMQAKDYITGVYTYSKVKAAQNDVFDYNTRNPMGDNEISVTPTAEPEENKNSYERCKL